MADDQTSPAPDANTYNAPAPWDPKVPDTLPIQQPSIQNIPGLSPEAYQRATSDMTSLEKKRIKEEEDLARGESASAKAYDARLERQLNQIGATIDDTQPWNPQTMAPPPHNLWEQFGSPGFVIGMLASSFTGMPMVSALNAGAAAMNAINEGDEANYHRAFDTWKTNTDLMLKRANLEQEAFKDIDDLRKNNMEEWHAKAIALAARFNDERALVMLQNGMAPDVIKNQEALATSVSNITDLKKKLEDNNTRMALVNAVTKDENGELKPEYNLSSPEGAKNYYGIVKQAEMVMAMTPQTVDQMVFYNRLRDPEFQKASTAEQNNMLIKDARDLSMAKFKGNIMQQEVERQWVEYDAIHPDDDAKTRNDAHARIASDVTQSFKPIESAKLTQKQAEDDENARHHKAQEDIAAGRISIQGAAEIERENHDRAMENIATMKYQPFLDETKAAVDEWTKLRDGVEPTAEMQRLIRNAYQSKGNTGAAHVAQVGNALAEINRKKISDGKLPTDEEQAAILRNSLLQSTTTAPMTAQQLDGLGWNAQTIDMAAETYNDTGKLPSNLGTRQVAANISGAIQNRAAQKLAEKYPDMTPEARADRRAQQWQLYSAQRVGIARYLSGPKGDTTRSLNVVVGHLQTMEELSKALQNGNVTRFNAIAQQWAEENGKAAPTNFDTAKQIVGAEVIKALGVSGAGTESERSQAGDNFKRSRSPQAIVGSIDVMRKLLVSQLKGLRQQFAPATGLDIKWFDSMLDPQTVQYLNVGRAMQNSTPPVPGAVFYQPTGKWYTRAPNGDPVEVK